MSNRCVAPHNRGGRRATGIVVHWTQVCATQHDGRCRSRCSYGLRPRSERSSAAAAKSGHPGCSSSINQECHLRPYSLFPLPSLPRRVTDDTCLAIAAALAPPAPTPLEQPFREASPPPYTISPQLPPDNKTQAATAPAAAVTPDCHVSAAAGPVLRVLGCARVSPLLGEEGLAALAGALATCLTCLDLSGNAHLEGRGTTMYDMDVQHGISSYDKMAGGRGGLVLPCVRSP